MTTTRTYSWATLPLDTAEIIDGSLKLDETWSPYGQGSVRIKTPADTAQLDPRADFLPIAITASHAEGLPMGYPTNTVFNLAGRGRSITDDGTTMITLATDEAMLGDYLGRNLSPGTSLLAVCNYVLGTVIPGTGVGVASIDGDLTDFGTALQWRYGVDALTYLEPLLQYCGAKLWQDVTGYTWHLTSDPISVAADPVIIEKVKTFTDTISRDSDWYNYVQVKWAWEDDAPVFNLATSPGSSPSPQRGFFTERTFPGAESPGAGGLVVPAAAGLLPRVVSKGRTVEFTAMNNFHPNLRPGWPLQVTDELLPVTGTIQSVSWDFGTDEMTVVLRDIE